MTPKVSVILTSYNKMDFIGKAIDSICSQTFKDFELIIVDDGSNDNSLELLKEYEAADDRIKVYSFANNRGIPSAHNYGIEHAVGEYCAMIDCDDYWEKDKLEKQVGFLEQHLEYGACFSWVNIIDENDNVVRSEECEFRDVMWNSENHSKGEWLRIFFMEGCKLSNPSMVIRRNIFNEIGSYSFGLKQLQDYEIFIRILKKYNVYVLPEKLVNYRWFMGKNQNTSADNLEASGRTMFEYYLICRDFFKDMKESVFLEGFQGVCIKEGICLTDMQCAQIFILKNYFLSKEVGYAVGMERMYSLLNNREYRKILQKEYNVDSSTFAEGLKKTIFFDAKYFVERDESLYSLRLNKENERITQQWYQADQYAKELEKNVKIINEELGRNKAYSEELEEHLKETVDEMQKTKSYCLELEDNLRSMNDLDRQRQNYIAELETNLRSMNDLDRQRQNYIAELETRVKEGFELYTKCNEYATTLENQIRGMNS